VNSAENSAQVDKRLKHSRKLIAWTTIAVLLAAFQAAQLFHEINRYAVDVPFMDQWDLYEAFITPHSLWEIFSWQHGPHRQGAGFFLISAINEWTGWDQRAQAFMVGVVMVGAAIAALGLKRRLFGSVHWHDAIPVLMILSWKSWELYAGTPNVSHGALPLFLILLIGLSWTFRNSLLRYGSVVVLNFLAMFTGFGIFVGLITPILLIVDCAHDFKSKNLKQLVVAGLAFACAIATIGCFYHNYSFTPVAESFQNPHWYLYPIFIAIEFSSVILPGHILSIPSRGVGLIAVGVLLCMIWSAFLKLLKRGDNYRRHQTIFFLIAFSMAFAVSSAVGRMSLGWQGAIGSRYVPLLLPAVIGAYFFLLDRSKWCTRGYAMQILLCAAVITAVVPWQARKSEVYRKSKAAWVQAYRLTGNIMLADSVSAFPIYPNPARTELARKLEWLRKQNYSLFRKQ
jgi:hypothetical protein